MRVYIILLIPLLLFTCDKDPISPGPEAGDPITDFDGNIYQTIKIGNQVWMAENLRTTKYNDGSDIPLITDSTIWALDSLGGYCYYNNTMNSDSISKFGALYNCHSINTKKLAISGWRVPDSLDWDILENFLISNGYNWDGTTTGNKIAKSLAAKTDWENHDKPGSIGNDLSKNNKSGFSALPSGYRNQNGSFLSIGFHSIWWSEKEFPDYGQGRTLYCGFEDVKKYPYYKTCGFSVRLVKE